MEGFEGEEEVVVDLEAEVSSARWQHPNEQYAELNDASVTTTAWYDALKVCKQSYDVLVEQIKMNPTMMAPVATLKKLIEDNVTDVQLSEETILHAYMLLMMLVTLMIATMISRMIFAPRRSAPGRKSRGDTRAEDAAGTGHRGHHHHRSHRSDHGGGGSGDDAAAAAAGAVKAIPASPAGAAAKAVAAGQALNLGAVKLQDIVEYDGVANERILICLRGVIYDVTRRPDMYGPGAAYSFIAGKDASRALAEMSIDPDLVNLPLQGLSQQQLDALHTWETFFKNKYAVVGTCIDAPSR